MGKIGVENVQQSNSGKSSGITPISKDVVHKICSGQVVLTLAVAVKELLENSLDAGATAVDVRLVDQGSAVVEVADNGSGIKEEDFEGIALKHHTSKLSDFTDLETVSTFGFRGEALSSLCSLCGGLSIVTCHRSSACAFSLEFDASGILIKQKPCARQIGTTVTLNSLFSGLPVRRKEFLRHLQREFTKMTHLLYAYCLVSTGVRITCTSQKQTKGSQSSVIVATQGGETVRDNIGCVFGHKQLLALVDFKQKEAGEEIMEEFGLKSKDYLLDGSEDCEGLERRKVVSCPFIISGCISSCEHGSGRSAPDRQFFFINSRPCEPTKVARVVNEVYHQYNSHQYPFVFLNIKVNGIDGSGVDVNVTPDKRQIFIENEKLLLATIKASLLEMYKFTPSTFKLQNLPSSFVLSKVLAPEGGEKETPSNALSTPQLPKTSSMNMALSRFAQTFGIKGEKCDTSGASKKQAGTINNSKIKQPKLDGFVVSKRTTPEEPVQNDMLDSEVVKESKLSKITVPEVVGNLSQNSSNDGDHGEDIPSATGDGESINLNHEACSFSARNDSLVIDCIGNETKEEGCCVGDTSSGLVVKSCGASKRFSGKRPAETPLREDILNNKRTMHGIMSRFSFKNDDVSDDKSDNIHESKKTNAGVCETDFLTKSSHDHHSEKECETGTQVVILDDEGTCVEDRDLRTVKMHISLQDIAKKCEKQEKKHLEVVNCESKRKLRFNASINPKENSMAETELQREITKDMFSKMEVIGQFNLGFLITKLGSDLFIIDQHASDEKYNFETLQRTTCLQQQPLVVPQPLDLTVAAKSVLLENIEVFEQNGFRFSFPSEDKTDLSAADCKAFLTSIPFSRNWTFGKEDVDELIFMLQDSPHANCRPSRVRDMFASRACRKSVMIGDALAVSDMRRIIDHMGQIDQPWNCPHGRPTMRHLINLDLLASDLR
ncbi:mismatch repair endonuclease PMS2 [Ischnura elegans]|uniref:mismatch repair endonuclease PMS2 n=1 Tax=Ischnura elegans TaxID=197161 RepID=UPI001ED8B9E1|nr:mismatch repair endonuclease PMS2 [Ischnura elegans]